MQLAHRHTPDASLCSAADFSALKLACNWWWQPPVICQCLISSQSDCTYSPKGWPFYDIVHLHAYFKKLAGSVELTLGLNDTIQKSAHRIKRVLRLMMPWWNVLVRQLSCSLWRNQKLKCSENIKKLDIYFLKDEHRPILGSGIIFHLLSFLFRGFQQIIQCRVLSCEPNQPALGWIRTLQTLIWGKKVFDNLRRESHCA